MKILSTVLLAALALIGFGSDVGLGPVPISAGGNASFGTVSATGAITTTGAHVDTTGTTGTGSYERFLISGGANTNWLLGNNFNVSQGFEITPSTATGGSTFSTPVLKATSAAIGFLGATAAVQQANTVDADTALVTFGFKASGGPRGRRMWTPVQTSITVNSANTDVATISGLPAKWRAAQFVIWEASTSLTTATVQLMTAASGAGTNVFTSTPASLTSATGATIVVAPGMTTNQYFTASTLYFRNVTAQGAPATVSISFEYIDLTP